MRWMKLNKIMRKKSSSSPLDFLCKEMVPILNFFEASQIPLDRGLYLGYLKMQSSLNTIRVTVPDNMPSSLPYVTVRSTPHVSQEEWEWIRSSDSDENTFSRPTPTQHNFHQQLMRATEMLLRDLDLEADLIRHHRLFKFQVLQLHPDVSFILVNSFLNEINNCLFFRYFHVQKMFVKLMLHILQSMNIMIVAKVVLQFQFQFLK